MRRRATLAAVITMFLVALIPEPANAKGPSVVDIRTAGTGTVTLLDVDDPELFGALWELTGPRLGRDTRPFTGRATFVAALTWRVDKVTVLFRDRVVQAPDGRFWIRQDAGYHPARTWVALRHASALRVVLAGLEPLPPKSAAATELTSRRESASTETSMSPADRWIPFGLGAATGVAVAVALMAAVGRRTRRRSS